MYKRQVRAMAPVAGRPPNSGAIILAAPWAISSVFESWRSPMTPSATAADNRDSTVENVFVPFGNAQHIGRIFKVL